MEYLKNKYIHCIEYLKYKYVRYNKLSLMKKVGIWMLVFTIIAVIITLISIFLNKGDKINISIDESSEFNIYFTDEDNRKLNNYEDVLVLDHKIISGQKGYMRIRVNNIYLNTNFDKHIALRYKRGEYQPIMLNFENDKEFGPCIMIVIIENEKMEKVCLFHGIRFDFGLRGYFYEDIVIEIYFNDTFVWIIFEEGQLRWEYPVEYRGYKPPPINLSGITVLGYFVDEDKRVNRKQNEEIKNLKEFFRNYK